MTTKQTSMRETYAISNGHFTELSCQDCADMWRDDHGLTWNSARTHTIDESDAYCAWEPYGEADSVATCASCGIYLDMSLTPDGREYLAENRDGYPAFVLEYHGIE